ncbi:MAG: VOC family protein [Devosia sp.]|nr:VOC family protein [Devosia sp.]
MIDISPLDALPLKLVQKLGPKQVSFVVRDLEAAATMWWDLLHIGPWTAWEYTPAFLKEMTYQGQPAQFGLKHALAWKDGVQFELVQPTTGPSIFTDQLQSSGQGLNHLGIHVMEDHQRAVEEVLSAGFVCVQSARGFGANGDGAFAFFSSPQLNGLILELIGPPAVRREPHFVYPRPEESQK